MQSGLGVAASSGFREMASGLSALLVTSVPVQQLGHEEVSRVLPEQGGDAESRNHV